MKKLLLTACLLLLVIPAIVQAQGTVKTETAEPEKQAELGKQAEPGKQAKPVPEAKLTVDAQLCSGIAERMPLEMTDTFTNDIDKVWLWCKIEGAADSTYVKHVYYYKGEQVAEVELPVNSPSWRTWSSKTILPNWVGDWEVKIVDAGGNVLKAMPFKITTTVAQDDTETE
jgi:DUF2914 family protein